MLAVLSLVLAAALFLAYQYRETKTAPILLSASSPTPTPAPTPTPSPAASVTENGSVAVGPNREVQVGGGKGIRSALYDDAGNTRGSLIAAEWRPLGESSTKVEVVSPQISIHTPGGQIIELAADRGIIERKSANLSRMELRNAELRGAVHITIDRLTDAQRKALPADSAAAETDRYIQLTMDDLFFDLEFARVQTDGPFKVHAAEAEIEGRGLNVRYNELEGRVEELLIAQGERILVANLGNRFRVAGLSTGGDTPDDGADATEPRATPIPTPTPTPPTVDGQPPLLAEDEPRRPHERPTDSYTAIFEGEVSVQEYEGDEVVGRLAADYLRILFDFSQRERELARQAPAATAGSASPKAAATTDEAPANHIVLTWSGPLKITSERLAPPAKDAPPPPQRIQLTATGERVVVDDGERRVECRKLVYRNDPQAVELTGTVEFPAHVSLADGGELFGREIMLDRAQRQALARGPGGRLIAAPQRGESTVTGFSLERTSDDETPLEVRFEKEVVVAFDTAAIERFDVRTGQMRKVEREVLRSAVFTGQVRMVRGDDRFRGERIELDLGLDPNGKQYPTQVRAYENVVAAQGPRYISAAERLVVDFELLEKPREQAPFNLAAARQAATERGENADAIDWAAVRTHYEAQRDYRPGIKKLDAVGNAEVRDPDQQLEIDCEILQCRFRGGREIESGLVTPRHDGRAFVALGAFSISAPQPIPFDALAQTASVEGPGRMTFPSKQDIDGRALAEPLIVGIQWTERMAFDGKRNEAIFHGQVKSETERSRFTCGNLRIDFEDQEPPADQAVAAPTDNPENWWVLQPIIDRAAGRGHDDGVSVSGPSVRKRPVYLYATDGVQGQSENHDAASGTLRSRVLFQGPMLAVDLRQRQMLIDGAGALLIEDYRKAKTAGAGDDGLAVPLDMSPFGRLVGGEASQTAVQWDKAMTYHDAQSTAEFTGNVALTHSTGAKMKRAADIIGAEAAASGKGREATLTCQTLTVRFGKVTTAADRPNAGMGPMSGTDVDAFAADGQVHFSDAGISAIAARVEYQRQTGVLDIFGAGADPAEIFVQRERFSSFKGPHFQWNRKTNQLLAPKSSGGVH